MNQPPSRWLPVALHLCLLYAAAAMATSWVLLSHNSDTVLPALISIEKWTPWFWGENRFGMLVPLLASPIRDYGLNLLAQNILTAWCGLLAVYFIGRLSGPEDDSAMPALYTALAFAAALLVFKTKAGLILLLQSNYLPPLAMLLGGFLLLVRPGRIPNLWRGSAFISLLILALWINVSMAVFVGVLAALWHPTAPYTHKHRFFALAAVAGSFLCVALFAASFPSDTDHRGVLPPGMWLQSLSNLLRDASANVVSLAPVLVLLAAGAALTAFRRSFTHPGLVVAIAAAAQIGLTSASEWVARNQYDSRYITGSLLVLLCAAISMIVFPNGKPAVRVVGESTSTVLACLVLLAISTRIFGIPSLWRGEQLLEQVSRSAGEPFRKAPCTHVLGDFWTVWMAVYYDRLISGGAPPWGLTSRSEVTRPTWNSMPEWERRWCAVCDDPMLEHYRRLLGVPALTEVGREDRACVFRAAGGR